MTMFKKYISLLTIALVGLLSTGCDNFLDIQPVGKVIPTTASEFRSLLSEAYLTVPADRGLAGFRSDEAILDPSMAVNDLNSYLDIWRWNDFAADENTATFSWRQFYHVLFIANYVIESAPNIKDGAAEEVDQLKGEAYMLRAYMHFILANLHAPAYTVCAPASTKAIPLKLDSDVEGLLSRNTVEEVYASVLSDLVLAEKLLNREEWPVSLSYRFTTLSVDALRSRVHLYMGNWDEAQAAAERVLVVKNTLADPRNIDPARYDSPEVITALENVMNAQYVRAVKVNRDFFRSYTSTDLRKKVYFNQVTASNILLIRGGSDAFRTSLRVAEIYLNAAEAAARAGRLDEARAHLLTLQRARYSDGGAAKETAVANMNREDLITEILAERARELAFEGHRWFDLRRNGQPRLEKSFKGESVVLEEGDNRYTIRIPAAAILVNPGLAD